MSSKLSPVKRTDLIARLRKLGFDGPFSGGKHQFLVRGPVRLVVPNPHATEIGPSLLVRILHQAGITRAEWEATA